jgi:branched-chain amino acid transport system substrate-binding protein
VSLGFLGDISIMKLKVVTALAGSMLALAACGSSSTSSTASSASKAPVRIGVDTSLTGPLGALGLGEQRGAEMAVSQLNASGGIDGHHVILDVQDDQSNSTQSLLAYQNLVAKGDVGVVGSIDDNGILATVGAMNRKKVPYIATAPIQGTTSHYLFGEVNTGSQYGSRLVPYMKAKGLVNVAVLYDSQYSFAIDAYKGFVTAAKAAGINIKLVQTDSLTSTDFSASLSKVSAANVQALVVLDIGAGPVILAKQFAALGLSSSVKLLMTGAEAAPEFLQPAGTAANGIVMDATPNVIVNQLPASPLKTALTKLSVPYQQKYGRLPSQFATSGYTGVELIAAAIEKGKSTSPASITKELSNMSILLPGGDYHYSATNVSGLQSNAIFLVRVVNGAYVPTSWQKKQFSSNMK